MSGWGEVEMFSGCCVVAGSDALRGSGEPVRSTYAMHLARDLCTRVIVLDEGCVVADSEASAILSDQALLEQHGLELPRKGKPSFNI